MQTPLPVGVNSLILRNKNVTLPENHETMPQLSFTVIGISDAAEIDFAQNIRELLIRGTVFSGGKRHYELISNHLPASHQWIDITVPLQTVYEQYRSVATHIIVFASGDPLFFGFGATLLREFPDAPIHIVPHFNSLQMLAHRALIPYHDIRNVSLTGRPWHELDRALIQGEQLVGILTDKLHTPATIAQRMLQYGYGNYSVTVGENLGGTEERIRQLTVEECALETFAPLNCLIIRKTADRARPFGIHESQLHCLAGRPKMITKDAFRLMSLSKLNLHNRQVMWDVGFCTGSVSVEAKLQFPHLKVVAFEQREESAQIIQDNMERFGTPGIDYHIGDFFNTDLSSLPVPDAIFIGGHGGRLFEMMGILTKILVPGGRIVINAVTDDSKGTFIASCAELGLLLTDELRISINEHNPLSIITAEKPV